MGQHDSRQTGTVKRVVGDKGFGFIATANDEFFFHRSSCDDFDRLHVGDQVAFTATIGSKGPRAEDVIRAT